jgi:MFS family permease
MKIAQLVDKIYFDSSDLNKKDYEKGRRLFIYEGSFAGGIFSLTSGAFLAGLASFMGASDEFNGIIGAIPVFAGVAQSFSSLVFEKLERRKFLVSIMCLMFRVLLGIMFFIPFVFKKSATRLLALAAIYGIAYVLAAFITPAASNWIVSLTPDSIRGKYLAKKDAYSLAFITILTIIFGKLLDIFKGENLESLGFGILGVIIVGLALINFYFLSSIKEPKVTKASKEIKLKDVFIKPLIDKKFKLIIILFLIWNIALQIAGPFFSVYMVTGLELDYLYIMLMGVISSLVRVIVVPYWGRIADNKSWITCTKYSIAALALCHFLWMFVNSSTVWFFVPFLHVLGGIAWAGLNIALFNIQFLYSPADGRTMYLGANAAIGGLLGFLSTILGSFILTILGEKKILISSFSIGNMQIIFGLSGVLIGLCALYVHMFFKETKNKSIVEAV